MLVIDGKAIVGNLDRNYKDKDPLFIAIADKLKEIDKRFARYDIIKLKLAAKYRYKDIVTGDFEEKGPSFITFKATAKFGGQTRSVIYAETSEIVEGKEKYFPNNESFKGSMTFTVNDTEKLLFYLLFEPRIKSGMIVLEDLEQDATNIATTRMLNVDLQFYLYSDASPLTEERLKIIALNWAINPDKCQTLDILKNRIFEAVMTEEGRTGKAIAQFKEQTTHLSDEVKAISVVSQAVYRKLIEFNQNDSQWQYKGDKLNPILKIPMNERSNEMGLRKKLASFMIAGDTLYKLREMLGEEEAEPVDKTDVDIIYDSKTEWDSVPYLKLKQALRGKQIKVSNSAKQPELVELCRNAYSE